MPQKRTTKAGKVYWVGRVRIPGRGEIAETFPKRKEALDFEVNTKSDLAKGKWVEPKAGKVTVSELVDRWVASAQTTGTRDNRKALRNNLGDLERMPVQAVRPADLDDWIDALASGRPWAGGRALAPSTMKNMRGQLSGIFTRAVHAGMIGKTPFAPGVAVVPIDDDEDEGVVERLLTPDQITSLITTAREGARWKEEHKIGRRRVTIDRYIRRSPALAAMIEVACGTGLRVGEVAGLTPADVDRQARLIRVRRQAKTSPTGFRKLKSKKSRRDIPVADRTLEVIDAYLKECPQPDEHAAVFRTVRGTMWVNGTISTALRKLRVPTGVDWVTFHDFRHFYASALIGGGLSSKAVADLLGHSTPSVTLKVYAHLWPEELDKARIAVAQLSGLRGDRGDAPRPDLRVV